MRDVDVKAIGCTSYLGGLGRGLCWLYLPVQGWSRNNHSTRDFWKVVTIRVLSHWKAWLVASYHASVCVLLRSFLSGTVWCNTWGMKGCMILIIPMLLDAHGRWNSCYALNFSWFQFGTICSEYASIERDVWLLNVTLCKIKERCFCYVTFIKL